MIQTPNTSVQVHFPFTYRGTQLHNLFGLGHSGRYRGVVDARVTQSNLNESDSESRSLLDGGKTRDKLRWSPNEKLMLSLVLLSQLATATAYSLIGPFFSQEAELRGSNPTINSMIFAFFQLVIFLVSPIYGYYIARLGPKFLTVAGTFLCGGCCILFGLLKYTTGITFVALSFIIRGVEGNGEAMSMIGSLSLLVGTFPSQISTVAGYIEMCYGLGCILGPLVGAGLYAVGGYYLPFVVTGSLLVISAILLQLALPEIVESESQTQNFLRLMKIPGVSLLSLHCLTASVAMTYLDPTLSDWATKKYGITVAQTGLIFTGLSLSYTLSAPIAGWISDKGYPYTLMLVGLVGSSLTYLLLGPSPVLLPMVGPENELWKPIAISLFIGVFCVGIYIPPYLAILNLVLVNGHTESLNTVGMISGLLSSSYSLGAAIGPLMSGFMTDRYGFEWSITIMAFTVLTMGLIMTSYLAAMKIAGKPLSPAPDTDPDFNSEEAD